LSHSGHLRSLLALSAFSLAFLSSSSLLFLPVEDTALSKADRVCVITRTNGFLLIRHP